MSPVDPPRILVLEDEPMILMELCFAVEDQGALCLSATSARPALEIIEEDPPHAAILDVHLGHEQTCEPVAEALHARGIPFLLHSGDLVRQGELIARIGAEVIAKLADSDIVARRAVSLAQMARER
jgi:DNA-binding response OmpR family regulator